MNVTYQIEPKGTADVLAIGKADESSIRIWIISRETWLKGVIGRVKGWLIKKSRDHRPVQMLTASMPTIAGACFYSRYKITFSANHT